jgi:hypothetical protein
MSGQRVMKRKRRCVLAGLAGNQRRVCVERVREEWVCIVGVMTGKRLASRYVISEAALVGSQVAELVEVAQVLTNILMLTGGRADEGTNKNARRFGRPFITVLVTTSAIQLHSRGIVGGGGEAQTV